jgi:hypothetical protein
MVADEERHDCPNLVGDGDGDERFRRDMARHSDR